MSSMSMTFVRPPPPPVPTAHLLMMAGLYSDSDFRVMDVNTNDIFSKQHAFMMKDMLPRLQHDAWYDRHSIAVPVHESIADADPDPSSLPLPEGTRPWLWNTRRFRNKGGLAFAGDYTDEDFIRISGKDTDPPRKQRYVPWQRDVEVSTSYGKRASSRVCKKKAFHFYEEAFSCEP